MWTYPSTLQAYHGLLSFTVHSKPKVCPIRLLTQFRWLISCGMESCSFIFYAPPDVFPQVRKAAQQGVCSILRGSDFLFTDKAPSHHPAAATTAKFCIKEMEQAGGKFICVPFFFVEIMFAGQKGLKTLQYRYLLSWLITRDWGQFTVCTGAIFVEIHASWLSCGLLCPRCN